MLRASSFGGCIRAQVAAELGYQMLDPPARMQKVFDAGTVAEETVIALLLEEGQTIVDRQREIEFAGISGHIDGVIGESLLEIKSFSSPEFQKWEAEGFEMPGLMQRYKWQVSVYMHALGMPLMLVGYDREKEVTSTRNQVIPFYTWEAIHARANLIQGYVDAGELPPCDQTMYPCPVVYLHTPDEKDSDPLIEELGEQYQTLLDAEAQLADKKTKVRASLEAALGERETVDCEHVKVSRYWAANPSRADIAKLKKDGLWDKYQIDGGKSRRLRVTLRD